MIPTPLPIAHTLAALLVSLTNLCAQRVVFATHDWNHVNVAEKDTWADVKTPGNGLTYSVGTTIAFPPGPQSLFSTQHATYASLNSWPNASKQVAVLQIAEPGQPAGIQRQAYFHGIGSLMTGITGASTYARAISVWPSPNLVDTRIAICGSTRDPQLPLSPTPLNVSGQLGGAGWPPDTGFIAVYDGQLTLLWCYHFFADDQDARTTITDVSIRVDLDENNQLREYVTYCGTTNNGTPRPRLRPCFH